MGDMLALVKTSPTVAELVNVPIPECGPEDVLVRVRAAALCGTDLHIFAWNAWAQGAGIKLPFIMGHEFCGDVAAVGSAVKTVSIGDKVSGETHVPCGYCYQCLNGEQHICNNLRLFGVHRNGCFAEYAVIPAVCAKPIPPAITYETGSVMEPLGTALRAIVETNAAGTNVVVLGCGPIGLFAVASAACLGAAGIIAADISDARLKIAAQMGAGRTINPTNDDLAEAVLRATNGYGADIVIDASGSVAAVKQSFSYLRKGGKIALIGLPDKPIELELGKEVVFKEAKIIGIHGRKMFETWTQMENLLSTGKLLVAPAITHALPLSRWREGIELAQSGQACKVIFNL
ncbi:L-threonine 3-dehydrogenase [Anaeroselena agilis]|uniref:L-threonine 3-dehydrogenase n=1 Tax=Anaeroselena agilis TaxID=3063788 RepID=A0ABU3NUQ4_9FIRM|nr:L-threonine 3-dehydrogenase [Selenomonadales bacterium 4137-cl]